MIRVLTLFVVAAAVVPISCSRNTGNAFEGKVLLPSSEASATYLEGYIADGHRKFDIHIKSDAFRPGAEAYVQGNTQGLTGVDARIVVTQERVKTGTVRGGRIIINYGVSMGDFDMLPKPPTPFPQSPNTAPHNPGKRQFEPPPIVRL